MTLAANTATTNNFAHNAEILRSHTDAIESAIFHARLPTTLHFNYATFRCRARVLGNAQRFAIALTVFVGRTPFTAEDRVLRRNVIALGGSTVAERAAHLEIKMDNWVIATTRFPVMSAPSREMICTALALKLSALQPALSDLQSQLVEVAL